MTKARMISKSAEHHYRGHTVQMFWGTHFLIKYPEADKNELWTNSFKIVREELSRSKQLKLFQ